MKNFIKQVASVILRGATDTGMPYHACDFVCTCMLIHSLMFP